MNKKIQFALTGAICLLASACGTRYLSHDITDDGKAGEIVFPAVNDAIVENGIVPDLGHVRTVRAGISKDELRTLFGVPHFREGYYGVREWDYIFRIPNGNDVTVCQYKIIFDKEQKGQSFYWSPESCAELIEVKSDASSAAAGGTTAVEAFDTEVLFAFAKADLSNDGKQMLTSFADKIKDGNVKRVDIRAYADEIGTEVSNIELSKRRAETVKAFLTSAGISGSDINAYGLGESDSKTTCNSESSRNSLIQCLAPDRRVEITVIQG